ncbi:hypothetical protein L6R52_26830 [Myxococcota bacterium]|nr:hypothetical protein [Myxococcota bacterium]
MPSIVHLIYIPVSIAIGVAIGWMLGTRAVRKEWARAEKRRRDQEES